MKRSQADIELRRERRKAWQRDYQRQKMLNPEHRARKANATTLWRLRKLDENPAFRDRLRTNARNSYYKTKFSPFLKHTPDPKKTKLNRMAERQAKNRRSQCRMYVTWWKTSLRQNEIAERKRSAYVAWWNRTIEKEYCRWWNSVLPHPLAKDKIELRLKKKVRARLKQKLQRKSGVRTIELIGCSLNFLRRNLESQFKRPMSWENYGTTWHIDHIIPLSKFNLRDAQQQKAACHYSNIQPLDAWTNCAIKRDLISIPVQPELLLALPNHT